MNLRLIIVQCGGRKIWDERPQAGPMPARDVYTSPYFRKNKTYAEQFGDAWMILSAKYGFMEPDFVIPENYNTSFKRKSTHPITNERLRAQVVRKNFSRFGEVEVLGGQEYLATVEKAFEGTTARILAPFTGLAGIGYIQQKVTRALSKGLRMDDL